jgi:hypothetical protein
MPKNRPQNKKRPLNLGKSPFRGSGSSIAINKLLARDSTLHNIGAIAAAQQQWLAWLREQLPAELAPHVIQVVIKAGELIGYAESAAWCERLRYVSEPLLAKAQERDPAITRLRLRVSPASGAAAKKR